MPIVNENDRRSVLLTWILPVPDTDIGQEDRKHVCNIYRNTPETRAGESMDRRYINVLGLLRVG